MKKKKVIIYDLSRKWLLVLKQLEEYYKNTITCGELLSKNHVYLKNIRKQEKTGVWFIKLGPRACGTTFFSAMK